MQPSSRAKCRKTTRRSASDFPRRLHFLSSAGSPPKADSSEAASERLPFWVRFWASKNEQIYYYNKKTGMKYYFTPVFKIPLMQKNNLS